MHVDVVASDRAGLGESPVWSQREGAIYWIDTRADRIYRLAPASGARASWATPSKIRSIGLRRGGGLVVAMKGAIAFLDTASGAFTTVLDPEPQVSDSRPNDAKVDRAGRFWFGTMQDERRTATGRIYRLDPDRRLSVHDVAYECPNGPAWSPDNRTFYLADSTVGVIHAYDYDPDAGTVRNRRPFAHVATGVADGATVDSAGYLWSAICDAGALHRYAPDGRLDRVVELPVSRPTSLTFGGDDLRTLFVTTATLRLTPEELEAQPLAGNLIALRVDVAGLPEPEYAG
jgi:sugar lactone lactonase YvrE